MTVLMKGDPDLRAAFLFKMCDAQSNGAVERRDLLWVLNSSDNEQGKQVKLQELQRLTEQLFEQREQSGWAAQEQPRVNLKQFQEWSVRYREQSLLLKWLMAAPLESFIRAPIEAKAPGARNLPSNLTLACDFQGHSASNHKQAGPCVWFCGLFSESFCF